MSQETEEQERYIKTQNRKKQTERHRGRTKKPKDKPRCQLNETSDKTSKGNERAKNEQKTNTQEDTT